MSEQRTIDRLLFVFAADSGLLNAAVDSARKLLRLKGCALCAITHGLMGEKRDWVECKETLGVQVDYVHTDELTPKIEEVVAGQVPSILAEVDGDLILLVKPDTLERCRGSVHDLKGRIKTYAAMNRVRLPDG